MKIIVTGSLGHISRPLTEQLTRSGHAVTVISSNPDKQKDIEALGATAAIGSLEDVYFLTTTFTGADAVYCMIPPRNYRDHSLDVPDFVRRLSENYAQAIEGSGVKRAVVLSSIGAHLEKGNGILAVYHTMEATLNRLKEVAITFMRPTSFYYNLLGYTAMIRQGFIAVNYGEEKIVWVSPKDIAAAIADEIVVPLTGRKVRYVASDERTGKETAAVIGAAIGNPALVWQIIPDDQYTAALTAVGLQPSIAAGMTEMWAAARSGYLWEDYNLHKPAPAGNVKLEEYASEFAEAFNQK